MTDNIVGGLVTAIVFVMIAFGAIAGLIIIYHRAKGSASAKLEPGDRGYEREAKIFTLYQNLEDMLDGFDAYIEETRAAFEMEKIELLRQREEVARMHANILALSDKMDKQVATVREDRTNLNEIMQNAAGELERLAALREEIAASRVHEEPPAPPAADAMETHEPEPPAPKLTAPEAAFIRTRPPVVDVSGAMVPPTDALHIHKPAGRVVSVAQEPASRQIIFARPLPAEPAATSTSGRAVTIRHLFKEGRTVDEIARELGIARNEVTLTLKLMEEEI